MNVLHIFNDGPCEDALYMIECQSSSHKITVFDLGEDEVDYVELIKHIEQCDKVMSW